MILAGLLLVVTLTAALDQPLSPAALGLSVGVCVLMAVSGRRPVLTGMAIILLCSVLVVALPDQETPALYGCLTPLVTAGMAGLRVARRWFTASVCVLLFVPVVTRLPAPGDGDLLGAVLVSHAVFVLVAVTMAWAAGEAFRVLLRQQCEDREKTVRALRLELARDLHDGAAYALSVIAMRAEQGRRSGRPTVEDLVFIADRSREAIEDLRHVMAMLRLDEVDGPQVRMDWQVHSLAEAIDNEVRTLHQSGFTVAVTVEGALEAVPHAVAEAISRVMREAAGNVRRHAPEGECALLISVSSEQVELALINPLGRHTLASHQPLGIVGMRERVEVLGGTLEAGGVGSRWILRSALPLPTAATAPTASRT